MRCHENQRNIFINLEFLLLEWLNMKTRARASCRTYLCLYWMSYFPKQRRICSILYASGHEKLRKYQNSQNLKKETIIASPLWQKFLIYVKTIWYYCEIQPKKVYEKLLFRDPYGAMLHICNKLIQQIIKSRENPWH